jgi:hypothetical protein
MLTAYGLMVLLGWLLLLVSFSMMHASERTMSEVIRERR